MRENEFHRLLPACFARGCLRPLEGVPQLDPGVVAVHDLLLEALAGAPGSAGDWVLAAWRRPLDPDRAERLVLAAGWLDVRAATGWGHRLAREALAHAHPRVRAAAARALRRWADPAAAAILRTAIAEATPALAAELRAARAELDPRGVPSWDRSRRAPAGRP